MAEEKKPAAKKPAAKPAAKKETAAKKPAAKAPAAKAPAAKKPAAAAKPAAKAAAKPAAKKETAAKAPAAKKPAAAKAPATKTAAAKPAAKAPAAKKPAEAKAAAPKKETAAKADAPAKQAKSKKAATDKDARPGVVKLHHLRPAAGSKKAKTRVGRGEGSKGKTAGRGTKGTKARYQVRPGFQGGQLTSVMRAPKLRGFTNPFRVEYQVVNVGRLGELYPKGGDVTVSDLVAKGAVRKNQKVKVLADGDVNVALTVTVDKVSKQAAEKIVKAGGSVKE
ncbi:MAG: 50S ribosomal protein L15 [Pontimonas sp.]|jgi:large subunit ribosomal protein L15|nr:50S ribosomal protein L15 [Pontimonas sp.]MDP4688182.1 50S ribosomal protein L15 [Pontimonas sp.]MDP4817293.1 50S ribosomal protein L15 [Pontimonas sp.]